MLCEVFLIQIVAVSMYDQPRWRSGLGVRHFVLFDPERSFTERKSANYRDSQVLCDIYC